jgi:hypothetical protein
MLVGGVLLVLGAATAQGMAGRPQPAGPDPNAVFKAANFQLVADALTRYAATAEGRPFPAPEAWIGTLAERGLLPGNALPASPWEHARAWGLLAPRRYRQANELAPEAGLVDAGRLAHGARPTAEGTVLGAGHQPDHATFDAKTYGALVYDADPKGRLAVLYGIGRKGDQAVVLATRLLGVGGGAGHQVVRAPLHLAAQGFKVVERRPNHDKVSWTLRVRNDAPYDVPAYLTLFFEGGNVDDVIKVDGTNALLPAGKTVTLSGTETLPPDQGARLKRIRCEHDGHGI